MSDRGNRIIHTPDQRLRVFVSSTLQELADERKAARRAIEHLRFAPVMFELGARPHPPKDLYRAYLDQSHIFVGIYWQKYGWVAPDMDISGLEDEWRLSGDKPKLIYIKAPAADREPRLKELLDRIRNDDGVSYKPFTTPEELGELIENDLALLLTERFESTRTAPATATPVPEQPRHNLPMQLTHFIGREKEVAAVKRLIPNERLVTLTGPGGAGKTRLSLRVATDLLDEFADGVWFVELAPISDPALIAQTIATTIGLREEAVRSIAATLAEHLRTRQVLLILDNCEHLVEACARLADSLLRTCPQLHLLASSREALGVAGEVPFRVPALATPDPRQLPTVEALAQFDAVQLFIDRAATVMPTFTLTDQNAAAIAQVCHRLDGIPLAIELAAARVKLLKVDQIAARLDDRFRLLTGGSRTALPRQQTLRAAIDWSYDLLADDERIVMRRLGVFVGGWTLDAAEAICTGDGMEEDRLLDVIDSLLNKSMMNVDHESEREARYRMLDTIGHYAQDKLREAGEDDPTRKRHRDFYLQFAEAIEPELWHGVDRAAQLNRLEIEHDNLRAAIGWSLAHGEVEPGMRLAAALGQFWNERAHFQEGRHWLEAGLAQRSKLSPRVLAETLRAAGRLAGRQGDFEVAEAYAQESVKLWRELGDPSRLAKALGTLAAVAAERGEVERSSSYHQEALTLYRELDDRPSIARALSDVGWSAVFLNDYARGVPLLEESLLLERSLQDPMGIAWSALALGIGKLLQGEVDSAAQLLTESLALFHVMDNKWYIAGCLEGLADVASLRQQPERAVRLLGAHDRLVEEMGVKIPVFWERAIRQPLLAVVHTQIDEAAFKAAWEAGRRMSLAAVIEEALSAS